jgi:phytoene dehydrogenase-like protein
VSAAVVVGSGPNGLSAAITLAEAGRDVVVLEAEPRPGGAVVTEELTLPGFHHDTFSAVYPAGAASPVFARMGLERHGLRWVHPRYAMAHVLDGGSAPVLSRDLDETEASLDALRPGDGAAWRAFAEPWLDHFEGLRTTMLSGFPPLRGPARLLAGRGLRGGFELVKLLLLSAAGLGRDVFGDPGSRAWLYGAAMHGDVPPGEAGSGIAAAYLMLLGHRVGWPSPEGGAGRLTDALVGRLRELGGDVRTGARATGLAVRRGRVRGVRLESGEVVEGGIVVAAVTPRGLLGLAREALPSRYALALERFRYGPSTVKVDWALSGPIPWTAPTAREAGTVHVGGDEEEVLRATAPLPGGRVAERPFLLLGQQTIADPTRAPAGRHTAWAYTHGPQSADWARETEPMVERIEQRVEHFAPGFRERILARHVLGPAELEGRNANLVGGDVGAGSYALDQVVFRPVPSLTPYRTPVRGLYLGSASAFPGGAVHGVPGHAAARFALTESRLRPF